MNPIIVRSSIQSDKLTRSVEQARRNGEHSIQVTTTEAEAIANQLEDMKTLLTWRKSA